MAKKEEELSIIKEKVKKILIEDTEIEEKFKLMSKKELQLLIDSAKKELEGSQQKFVQP